MRSCFAASVAGTAFLLFLLFASSAAQAEEPVTRFTITNGVTTATIGYLRAYFSKPVSGVELELKVTSLDTGCVATEGVVPLGDLTGQVRPRLQTESRHCLCSCVLLLGIAAHCIQHRMFASLHPQSNGIFPVCVVVVVSA